MSQHRGGPRVEEEATLRTAVGLLVQSFQDLLKDLATLNRTKVHLESSGAEFEKLTEATPLQRRVFERLSPPPPSERGPKVA